jgi:hypothetical protein
MPAPITFFQLYPERYLSITYSQLPHLFLLLVEAGETCIEIVKVHLTVQDLATHRSTVQVV